MSKYSKEEQTNITGMAAELQAAINAEKEELGRLESLKYPTPPPNEPVLSLIEPQVPVKIKPFGDWARENADNKLEQVLFKKKFLLANILTVSPIAVVILTFALIQTEIGYYIGFLFYPCLLISILMNTIVIHGKKVKYQKSKDELVEEYKQGEEYQNAFAEASKPLEPQNEAIKTQYLSEKEKYDNELLPEYQKSLMVWKDNNDNKIAFVKTDLNKNVEALDTLYKTTQIIPSTYRTLDRLVWLYEDMSTSEHDIERSIDLLNNKEIKEELVHIQDHVDDMRRDLRDGFVGIYDAIQQGNEIQSDMLSNLESIRSGIRAGNYMEAGSLIQNHKRNKMLADIQSKM
ncbi:MAG: hypothetical protein K5745_01670 [Saccharofermentans sp.]|nr:hypothetical protein [Saccharofermentans sp.]